MRLEAKVFWTPKAGNSPEEYEDAYDAHLPIDDAEWNDEFCRCAVADGATQTSFSRLWAQLLVNAYCEGLLASNEVHTALEPLQEKWRGQVSTKPLPWFAQEKIRQGAFSTLMGLTFVNEHPSDGLGGQWTALAVGDSCLFQIRQHVLLQRFPLEHSADFNNSPALLSSNPISNRSIEESMYERTGSWETGDLFFLMTDALACWFLRHCEEQEKDPVLLLANIESQAEFLDFIETERKETDDQGRRVLRNDDITLFRIYVS